MKRYTMKKCSVEPVTKITLSFEGSDITDKKEYAVFVGDLVSFLYTENMEDVGKNDRIVRGRLIAIMKKPRFNIKQRTPNFNQQYEPTWEHVTSLILDKDKQDDLDYVMLYIDESTEYNTIVNKYPLSKILDMNQIDYEYPADPNEEIDTSIGLFASPKGTTETIKLGGSAISSASSADYNKEKSGITTTTYATNR